MKTKQEMLNALKLKRAEQMACFGFAVHLAECDICRSGGGTTTADLCAAGLEARGKHIAAGRAYDEICREFSTGNGANQPLGIFTASGIGEEVVDKNKLSARAQEAKYYYALSMQRIKDTPPPAGQKFMPGTRVKIAKNLGENMIYFPSDKMATVKYTYAHAYQRNDERSLKLYCLDIDGIGQTSWYDEDQLMEVTT